MNQIIYEVTLKDIDESIKEYLKLIRFINEADGMRKEFVEEKSQKLRSGLLDLYQAKLDLKGIKNHD